jgi:hypothetical protein
MRQLPPTGAGCENQITAQAHTISQLEAYAQGLRNSGENLEAYRKATMKAAHADVAAARWEHEVALTATRGEAMRLLANAKA